MDRLLEFVSVSLLELQPVRAVIVLVPGLIVVAVLTWFVKRRLTRAGHAHRGFVVGKVLGYGGTILVLAAAADAAEIPVATFLATAGVLTIAIGLAAQTSLSNLIAGLFLLVDKPFEIGQAVELEGRGGFIERITLLSTFMRTFDNIVVRWPNEVVLKATILNYAAHPVRRLDLRVGVAYGTDVPRARRVLLDAMNAVPTVLLAPPAEVWARSFLDSAVELEVRVWVQWKDFVKSRSAIVEAIHATLEEAGIEIPFPQRTVWMRDPATG